MDPNRLTVDLGLLHHAVTPLWSDKSKAWLAQWFSDNGFARAYGSNPANWSGLINPFTGSRSYSQTHAVGQRVDSTTPDATAAERAAGYRVFYIVANPENVITWHAGNWNVNQRSIAIENLGDYRNYPLRDGDMRVIADFFRPLDKKVGGRMNILLHNEVYSTACPARIAEGRDQIIHYINNPPAAPTPTPTPTTPAIKYERMPKQKYRFIRTANLWNFDAATQASMKSVKVFPAGDTLDIVGKAIYKPGSEYYMTEYSFGQADTTGKPTATNGVNKVDLELVAATPPAPVITTKEETLTLNVPHLKQSREDPKLAKGEVRIDTPGKDGKRTVVYTVTYTDGKETGRTIKSDTLTVQSVTEVTTIGTYEDKYELDPVNGENAANWLTRVFKWLMELLSKFNYKK